MKFFRLFCFLLMCCLALLSPNAVAEKTLLDSVVSLKTFSIEANRFSQSNPGQKSENIDSTALNSAFAQNLSDLLSKNNSFFIKTYGLGGLSTGSFRGTSASQTATLWNGFNLQSPMNGLLDYSLVPAFFMDDVRLSFGGAGALFGSGSMGGTVLMANTAQFNQGLKASVSLSAGSFDDYQQGLKIGWSNSKICLSAKVFNHTALNNFTFINTAEIGKPKQYQKHAKLEQSGILLENYFKLASNQNLSLRLWYQNNNRQIPAPIVSGESKQNQWDEFYRSNLEWKIHFKRNQLTFRTAYFDEKLKFNDFAIGLGAYSHSHSSISEIENSYFFNPRYYLSIGLNNTFISATSDGYGPALLRQNRSAAFASFHFSSKNKSWKNALSLRKEYYGSSQVPLTSSFGSEKIVFKFLSIKGNVSRNYRLPTFNDLFWTEQGAHGNADLKPESGWSGDLGLIQKINHEKFSFSSEQSIFTNQVKNMIVWQVGNAGIWSPENLSSVWSKGIELKTSSSIIFKKLMLDAKAKYSFTRSINTDITAPASTLGKQIFYVPLHAYQVELALHYSGFQLTYTHVFTGKRFTNNENTEYLKGFQVGTVQISKTIRIKKIQLSSYFQVANCWNEQYQIIAWRPMPMRNYQIGIRIMN